MTLTDLMSRARCLLLDFDGPICSVFAGRPAPAVAAQLQALVRDRLGSLPPDIAALTTNPLQLLRQVADLGDNELTSAVADACRDAEVAAIATAAPTPGADEVLRAAHDTGRRVVLVSNNATEAVDAYLGRHDLTHYVDGTAARSTGMDPRQLKPHPHLVRQGLASINADPTDAVFIGDSESDIEAGQAVGVSTIGYANKPGKHQRLNDADAEIVIEAMSQLVDAMRSATVPSAP